MVSLPTFIGALVDLRHQISLLGCQHEGEDAQDEGVSDEHDGKDVTPAHVADAQVVLVCLEPAHHPDGRVVPAGRVHNTRDGHQDAWGRGGGRFANRF